MKVLLPQVDAVVVGHTYALRPLTPAIVTARNVDFMSEDLAEDLATAWHPSHYW